MSSFRRWASACAVAALTFVVASCSETATSPQAPDAQFSHSDLTGNGAPSGFHVNLNIIGVALDKKEDFDAPNDNGIGSRIFVRLEHDDGSQDRQQFNAVSRINKIFLTPGDDFAVLDANATDDDGALFRLPADVSTEWEVYVRPLGKPGGEAKITTCAVDPDTGEVICSTESTVQMRTKGKSSFDDVSTELLTANILVDPDDNPDLAACLGIADTAGDDPAVQVRVNLFDPCLVTYFWDYDNKGLRLLQLRFYPVPTS